MPIEVRKDNFLRGGEKKPSLFSAAAAYQHVLAVTASRAHMTGGFLEQSELGENLARQSDLVCQRGITWGILDFKFWIFDCRFLSAEFIGLVTWGINFRQRALIDS